MFNDRIVKGYVFLAERGNMKGGKEGKRLMCASPF